MITGHVGVAYGLRAWRRDASLLALLVAAVLPDILDVGYAAAGFCSPAGLYSHSLPAAGLLAALTLAVAAVWTRNTGVALVMAAAVLLHVPADWITGFKYLWAGGPIVGLVLYLHAWLDLALEVVVVAAGWRLLRRDPRAPRWATHWVALVALFAAQATFDIVKGSGEPGKPSACGAAERARLERLRDDS
ncbi:MAG TPA: hypothetical protein VG916_00675 [Gemmatimonadaceae bacterium]|nr:hypothetical protein [Gemmatimonadaceae bacterium]